MKHPSDNTDDEPANKKLRTEDSLIPEAQFIQRNTVSFIPSPIFNWLWFTYFNALKCNRLQRKYIYLFSFSESCYLQSRYTRNARKI